MNDKILESIIEFNKWWKTNEVSKDLKKEWKRSLFWEVLKYLKDRQIIAITGLRRTGKTTLLYQLIDHLLSKGIKPKNILYFSFDEILAEDSNVIKNVIEAYKKTILKKELKEVYIFLDEVQHVEKWQVIVKRYYDLYPTLKFFVSGSASLEVKKKVKESLAGRVYDFILEPLKFRNFIELKGLDLPLRKLAELDFQEIRKEYDKLLLHKDELTTLLNEFILKGGFPELIEEESLEKIHKYIKNSVVDRMIFRDIPKTFKIKEPGMLFEILKIIASHPGQIFEYENIANSLSTTRQTVSNYVFYLKEAFLIRVIMNYTGSYFSGTRKARRVYLRDHGINNSLLGKDESLFTESLLGRIIETIVINHISAEYFWRR